MEIQLCAAGGRAKASEEGKGADAEKSGSTRMFHGQNLTLLMSRFKPFDVSPKACFSTPWCVFCPSKRGIIIAPRRFHTRKM